VHTEASEFARRGSTVLAFDHPSRMLAVGSSDGNSALRNEQRFASPEMAIRVFLSLEEPPAEVAPALRPARDFMRTRVLGQHGRFSIAILALVEGAVAFFSVYAAACLRYRTPVRHLNLLELEFGPLWPRAVIFALFVVLTLWAFGLLQQRPPACAAVRRSERWGGTCGRCLCARGGVLPAAEYKTVAGRRGARGAGHGARNPDLAAGVRDHAPRGSVKHQAASGEPRP
jgi:hypothetical protein